MTWVQIPAAAPSVFMKYKKRLQIRNQQIKIAKERIEILKKMIKKYPKYSKRYKELINKIVKKYRLNI